MGQKSRIDEKRDLAEKLFEEHGSAIFRFALRLAGNAGVSRTRSYLLGIALNKWRRIRPSRSESLSDMVASNATNLDQLLDLERAFRTLPRNLQEAFVLVKAEGLTSKEASEILKIPQGTVQARTHDAVHRMRKALTDIPISTPILSEAKP